MDVDRTVTDEKSAEKFKSVPLSSNTVSLSINDISENLEEQLILRLGAAGDFSIQLDETVHLLWFTCAMRGKMNLVRTFCVA